MENLAHTLTGFAIADLGFRDRVGRKAAWWTAALAANAPDLDILLWPIAGEHAYMMEHRGYTHSLLALPVLVPLVAWPMARLFKAPLKPMLWLAFWALLSHFALDLVTSWGTMLLSPVDRTRFALPWVFIVDPWFWVILTTPFWLTRLTRVARPRLSAAALLGLAVYIGVNGALTEAARAEGRALAERQALNLQDVSVWPTPLWPNVRSVVLTEPDFAHHAWVDVLGGAPEIRQTWVRNLEDPAVAAALATRPGRDFLRWAEEPIARVGYRTPDRRALVVEVIDLRFWLPMRERAAFAMVFDVTWHPRDDRYEVTAWRWRTSGDEMVLPGLDAPIARSPAP